MECNSCGGVLRKSRRQVYGLDLFECETCGFNVVQMHSKIVAASATDDSTLTTENYINKSLESANSRKSLFESLSGYQSYYFSRNIKTEKLRILEIGCGVAGRADGFISAGHSYVGIDLEKRFVEYAKSRGVAVYCVDFLDFESDYLYDVILCSQVLEHINDLQRFIGRVKKFLKPNGIFQCDVPNHDSVVSSYFKMNNATRRNRYGAIEAPFHLYGHTPGSLRVLMKRHFTSVKIFTVMPDDKEWGQATRLPFYWSPIKIVSRILNRESLVCVLASDVELE